MIGELDKTVHCASTNGMDPMPIGALPYTLDEEERADFDEIVANYASMGEEYETYSFEGDVIIWRNDRRWQRYEGGGSVGRFGLQLKDAKFGRPSPWTR